MFHEVCVGNVSADKFECTNCSNRGDRIRIDDTPLVYSNRPDIELCRAVVMA